jgi:hypothetical protein
VATQPGVEVDGPGEVRQVFFEGFEVLTGK